MNRIDEALHSLRANLERCGRTLIEEVSRYPTPIARCDVQLAALVESRAAVFAALRSAEELAAARRSVGERQWRRRLRRFAAALPTVDDAGLAQAAEGLIAALGSGW
jgi:hypothetical protein